jgi:hypothetical protein
MFDDDSNIGFLLFSPEDDLIEDRYMMDCFLKFLSVLIQLKGQYIFV